MNSPAAFTATQIAIALGASRQTVQRALANVREDGRQLVRGNEALAWSMASLPAAMQRKLERRATASGHRHAEHLLRAGSARWESPVPVNQLSAPVQSRAMKLREALSAPVAQFTSGLKGSALEELGLNEFQRVLGYVVTARQWRRIFNRTIGRDAGEENWSRLDLYLDEHRRAARPVKAAKASPAVADAEKILLGYAAQVREPSEPRGNEKALLWTMAFERTVDLIEGGLKPSEARRSMRRVLWKCGVSIAKNEETLGKLWRVKEAAWRAADGNIAALKDARATASGNFSTPEIPQGDIDLIIAHTVKFGGRVAQAWRHVGDNRMLTPEVQAYYEGAFFASKSYVPRVIRDAVTPEARMLRDVHHGPRTAKLNGAYITRDWSKVAAGDFYQADDVTLNNYYYARDEKGALALMRGQVLLVIDVRSACIIGFAILDSRNYNAHSIRTLITKTCDRHGLPRKGFYFEGGIWENSKLLKGDALASSDDLTWAESELGLRDLGLQFVHSRNPRSKPVERVIGELQNLLDGQPGDAGRNEMKDGFERLEWRKREVESGRAPASKYFLSGDEWTDRIEHFCKAYNHERRDGEMTRGLTPSQAWKNYQAEPLVKLPAKARYLLSHHRRPVVVGRNGITLKFGKQTFVYRNAESGKLRGQKVLAWFNPELPEILAVTDMQRENCFTVERSESVPAMDAPDDILSREMGRVEAHNGYARQRYRILAPLADLNARPTIMDHETARLGETINEQQQQALGERAERKKRATAGAKAFSRLGYQPRPDESITDRQLSDAEKLTKLLQEES